MSEEKDANQEKSDRGVQIVLEYLTKEGYPCQDVARFGKEHNGYDILAKKEDQDLKIEVKCSSKEKGIPDCFNTEFDENQNLIADYLYLVRIDENKNPKCLQILSKEEFDKYSHLHKKKIIIKISNKLKTDLKNKVVGKEINLNKRKWK